MEVRRAASADSSPASGASLRNSVDRVTQKVRLAPRLLDGGAMRGDGGFGFAARSPQPRDFRRFSFKPAERIEQAAMGCGIEQRAVVMLAVNFDQRRTEALEHLHADRRVVDEGAGAAVGKLHATQDQFVFRRNVVGRQQRARGMAGGDVEGRDHLPLLGALAHQPRVAAPAQRQREGIEQDRLAGAGLAGQHRQAGGKIDVQPVDQDDVADRKPCEHGLAAALTDHAQGVASRHLDRHLRRNARHLQGQVRPGQARVALARRPRSELRERGNRAASAAGQIS